METSELYETKFRQYLIQLGYRGSSQNMMPRCAGDLLRHHHVTDVNAITSHHIATFHQHLYQRPSRTHGGGLSDTYIHHHITSLRAFFNWLEQTGQITRNPISPMKFRKPAVNTRQPLTWEEIKVLFGAAQTLKETAILHLLYSCGLRRSEAVALDIADVHLKSQVLYVRSGKGKKRRAVPMTAAVCRDLETYFLRERTQVEPGHDQEAFILGKKGQRMGSSTHYSTVKAMMKRAGISGEASPHHLRHSIATHLLESGLSMEHVRDFLGHSRLESTQVYTKITKQQMMGL